MELAYSYLKTANNLQDLSEIKWLLLQPETDINLDSIIGTKILTFKTTSPAWDILNSYQKLYHDIEDHMIYPANSNDLMMLTDHEFFCPKHYIYMLK